MAVEIKSGENKGSTLNRVDKSVSVHDKKALLLVGARADIEGNCFVWFTEKDTTWRGHNQNNNIPEVRITSENSPIQHKYCGVTAIATLTDEPLKQRGGLVS